MGIRGQLQDLYYTISAHIEHGECFYDEDMFNDFMSNLDKMKELAQQEYNENRSDDEE